MKTKSSFCDPDLLKKILFSFIVLFREEMLGLTSIFRYGSTPFFPEDRRGGAVL